MITVFTCSVEDCANQGVNYQIEDAPNVVMCGGCGVELEGVPNE